MNVEGIKKSYKGMGLLGPDMSEGRNSRIAEQNTEIVNIRRQQIMEFVDQRILSQGKTTEIEPLENGR